MPRKKANSGEGLMLAPVDDYPEKTDDIVDDETAAFIEDRGATPDQDPTYHERNPRTVNDGPESDPNVKAQLLAEATGRPVEPVPVPAEEIG